MLRLAALLIVVAMAVSTQAQTAEPLEYYLPPPVQKVIAEHLATLELDEGSKPFLEWRGMTNGAYELGVTYGGTNRCDSLLLARTNRMTQIDGNEYKIIFFDDQTFGVHEWLRSPFSTGPEYMPRQCGVARHWVFVVRFDRRQVISAEVVF